MGGTVGMALICLGSWRRFKAGEIASQGSARSGIWLRLDQRLD